MPIPLQIRLIRTDLVAAGYEPELSDIRSYMDGSLSYPENRALVAKAFGYRAGSKQGVAPKNLDALTAQAGIWNRQQADRRRRASKPVKKATKNKRNPVKMKPLPAWQSDPWPSPGDDIDKKRKALPPVGVLQRKAGRSTTSVVRTGVICPGRGFDGSWLVGTGATGTNGTALNLIDGCMSG